MFCMIDNATFAVGFLPYIQLPVIKAAKSQWRRVGDVPLQANAQVEFEEKSAHNKDARFILDSFINDEIKTCFLFCLLDVTQCDFKDEAWKNKIFSMAKSLKIPLKNGPDLWPSAPCLCQDWFIWERLVVFLLLSVYKSPPGVFYVRWSEVTHPAPLLISVTSCFSPTQKMLRWCTEEQTATNYKKTKQLGCA